MDITAKIKSKYEAIQFQLNERSRRTWAATEAIAIGYGGIKIVHKATCIAESTIQIGKKEILQNEGVIP